MVLLMAIGHAKDARPALEFIRRTFGSSTILTFRGKRFPVPSEDPVPPLATDGGAASSSLLRRHLGHPGAPPEIRERDRWPLSSTRVIDAGAIATGVSRPVNRFIPERARPFDRELRLSIPTSARSPSRRAARVAPNGQVRGRGAPPGVRVKSTARCDVRSGASPNRCRPVGAAIRSS
jgi:hypothetical protein